MAELKEFEINGVVYTLKDEVARNAVGTPLVATLAEDMEDTDKIYVYAGSEQGYSTGHWYYYDGDSWEDGGVYQSYGLGEGTVNGQKLSQDLKDAFLGLFEAMGVKNTNGQTYLNALQQAFNSGAILLSISAVYTPKTVYNTDPLSVLRDALVVTAQYDDGTSAEVTNYTLSGTLSTGTSTITITYGGKTTTVSVTVTATPYVTNGLIHWWDALNNTGEGFDDEATTWKDLVGNLDLTKTGSSTKQSWTNNALYFNPTTSTDYQNWDSSGSVTYSAAMTIEAVISPTTNDTYPTGRSGVIGFFVGIANNKHRLLAHVNSDHSAGVYFNESSNACYPTGLSDHTNLHSIVGLYNAQEGSSGCYINGVSKTKSSSYSHTYGSSKVSIVRIGGYDSTSPQAYDFLGKIHAIRIYNKVLTAQEIQSNYAADVARYGLGS